MDLSFSGPRVVTVHFEGRLFKVSVGSVVDSQCINEGINASKGVTKHVSHYL